jgi:hypothetical protein
MVSRLNIEIWVIDKGGTKRGGKKRGVWGGKWYGSCWVLWPLCMFWCISIVLMEGAVSGIVGAVQLLQ